MLTIIQSGSFLLQYEQAELGTVQSVNCQAFS